MESLFIQIMYTFTLETGFVVQGHIYKKKIFDRQICEIIE